VFLWRSNTSLGLTADIPGTLLKEEVRFRFAATAGRGKWIHFRHLEIIWYDNAAV